MSKQGVRSGGSAAVMVWWAGMEAGGSRCGRLLPVPEGSGGQLDETLFAGWSERTAHGVREHIWGRCCGVAIRSAGGAFADDGGGSMDRAKRIHRTTAEGRVSNEGAETRGTATARGSEYEQSEFRWAIRETERG